VAIVAMTLLSTSAFASSHMDAPLITRDPSANTTDVYAFVDEDGGPKDLVVALGVYPFEEPGIGPNKYNFDDNVLYQLHVATGKDLTEGRSSLSYQFRFKTTFKNENTILQSFLGVVGNVGDANQNLVQTYTVTKVDHRRGDEETVLGSGIVPPNNEGIATPFYNQNNDGNLPAKGGVRNEADLDLYTKEAIARFANGYIAFAGQRDDGFYADILSIFDLFNLRNPGKDSQGGFNIHLMALAIPVAELGGDQQVVGVYATTSRRSFPVLRDENRRDSSDRGPWVQVARQGNPLFNEGLVAIVDKDRYSRTSPTQDREVFATYALNPELARLINAKAFNGTIPSITLNRTDIAKIFIPDLIKVDLSTSGARLTGTGGDDPTTGFSRLSIFGGDVLRSAIQDPFKNGGFIPGGWPNGRRFGDDVTDIAVTALASDLRVLPPVIRGPFGDGVDANDMNYSTVFPYESTPQNGRNHRHP
jgi:hypothetical protein